LQRHHLAVVQQGGQYQLDGIDDQCGAAQAASVRGMAFQNLNGTIGFGLTVVTTPGGTPVHLDATITFPGLNGTWCDSAGNAGNFISGAGIPGGAPRPVPAGGLAPGSVTTIQIASEAVTNVQIALDAVSGAHIANGSVTTADLAVPPRAVGTLAATAITDLSNTDQTIKSVTLTIPSNATAMISFNSSAIQDAAWCRITTGSVVESRQLLVAAEGSVDALESVSIGGTRFFDAIAGTLTFRLVCLGMAGSTSIHAPALNILFIPGP
jgi:hypothetical protein